MTTDARESAWNDFMGDYYAEEGPDRDEEARNDRVCFNAGWDAQAEKLAEARSIIADAEALRARGTINTVILKRILARAESLNA